MSASASHPQEPPRISEPPEVHEDPAKNGWAARAGAVLAPLTFVVLWFAPLPLPEMAHRLAAITGAVLIAWVTEVVPLAVTSLLIAPLLVLTSVAPARKAFAPYADPILFLFVGSFFAAKAMSRHGLDRRFALGIAGLGFVAGHPGRIRAAVMVGAMLMSMWISNTGTSAILLPVLLGMLPRDTHALRTGSMATGSLLGLAHASSAGGLATLVGTPPNAITARILRETGAHIGFLEWMLLGVPAALLMTLAVYFVVSRLFPAGSTPLVPHTEGSAALGPWTRAERVTALSFGLAVVGWIVPDLSRVLGLPWADVLGERLDPGAVAVLAASLLFMVPAAPGGPRVLTWEDAVHIEWGLILLFGGGISLGSAMFETGLASALGEGFLALTQVDSLWGLTAMSLILAVALTEVCSNTAAANMLVPLVIGAALRLGVSPIPPAAAVGLGASCAFMLPVATGPNALVYGTGQVSARAMMRVGLWLNLLAVVVLFALLRIMCPLLGWTG